MQIFSVAKHVPYPKVDYAKFDGDKMIADEAAHMEAVRAYLVKIGYTGKHTGEVIRFPVADGQALYMIAEGVGKKFGLVHLAYGDGYQYMGVEHLPRAKILAMAEQEKAYKKLFQRSASFWDNRKVGEIVHYHNGFGQFVRGEIVETPKGKAMKPIALVGKWEAYDLPRFDQSGELTLGYHAKQIAEGETMKPHESNIYESDPARFKRDGDPRTMEALDLTPPPLTAERSILAALTRLRYNVNKALDDDMDHSAPDQIAETRKALAKAKAMLEDAGI